MSFAVRCVLALICFASAFPAMLIAADFVTVLPLADRQGFFAALLVLAPPAVAVIAGLALISEDEE